MKNLSPTLFGPICAVIATVMFTLNDSTMKSFSDTYALHQLVMIRAVLGSTLVVLVLAPIAGGWHLLKTRRLGLHVTRASFVIFANMTFFLGLASMPLAEAVAIFFISPFLISIFSVIFLKEYVGPRRWFAILLGMVGVLIIVQPGTATFQLASILPVAAALGYAALHIMTRLMRGTENAVAMTFYIQVCFIFVGLAFFIAVGDGRFAGSSNASLDFLLRKWTWPEFQHWPLLSLLGIFSTIGGYFISQAYRVGEASLIASFEYLALPLSILFGLAFFGEVPEPTTWIGIILIGGSGLYTVWRENRASRSMASK